jgi:O-antigen/teichoic acid export membrane protein
LSRSLSHEVGILTLGRFLTYAVMFVVPMVNVRSLSVEEYGYYRQFWLIFETLSPIIILGFSRSLLYYLPRSQTREEKSTYITQTILVLTVGSVVAMAMYALMGHNLGQGLGAATRGFYWRLSAFTFLMVVTDYMEVLFVAQRRPIAQSVYHGTVWGAQALVVIVASYVSRDVSTIIWALTVLAFARFLFAIIYTHVNYSLSLSRISLRSVREQASFAVPVGLAGIALLLVAQTDKFIITRFLGREAFAIYSVGAFQVPLANIIRTSIGNVTFPLMAKYQQAGDLHAMRDLWRRSILKTAILFFPIFVFLEVTARPFITILFTEQYADATPVFMIYMLLFLRSSVETGAIIQAFHRTVFLAVGFAVGFVVNVALGVTLLNAMGRLGVPLATFLVMTALSVVNLAYSARLVGSSFFHLLPVVGMLQRFAAAAAPGMVMWLLYTRVPVTNFVELAAAGLVYTLLYAGLCAWTRLVTREDLRALIGRAPA